MRENLRRERNGWNIQPANGDYLFGIGPRSSSGALNTPASGINKRQQVAQVMLEEYQAKRNFQVTTEPPAAEPSQRGGQLRFVIQKHAARRLHYDLRLELDGVLLSWAVPKGPSLNSEDKRLAVQTEDHPLEYQSFEGNIPKGEYGAGSMIIWDRGTYSPDWNHVRTAGKKDEELYLRKGLAEGKLTFVLQGQKVRGSWTLVRIGKSTKDWLLRKNQDEFASEVKILIEDGASVVSGRTIDDVREGKLSAHTPIDCAPASSRKASASEQHKQEKHNRYDKQTERGTSRAGRPGALSGSKSRQPQNNAEVNQVLDQLEGDQEKLVLQVEGHDISFSNLNKIFWPETDKARAITKRNYVQYLVAVSPYALPHLQDRPITLLRYPNGVQGAKFYQKHWEHKLPEFVETVNLFGQDANTDQEYMLCNNLSTLLWLAQLADLELHTWHSRIKPDRTSATQSTNFTGSAANLKSSILNYPDFLCFDLDPYIYSGKEKSGEEPELNERAFKETCKVARLIKEMLNSIGAKAYIKTTGKTGLHLYVPIVRNLQFEDVRDFSEALGRLLLKEHPKLITLEWSIAKRTDKIFVDVNMNARGKTLSTIYSPRVAPGAPISVPLSWDELDDVYPTDFAMHKVVDRLEKTGDLWSSILSDQFDLSPLQEKAAKTPRTKRLQR